MFIIFLIIAAGLGYFIYQKYVTPTGNESSTTKTDPIYPSRTPKVVTSSSNVKAAVGGGESGTTSKFAKSSVSKSPVKKTRSPRPIQVITLGIGGDDLAPGVVKESTTPPPPVATPPPSLQAPVVAPIPDLNNNLPAPTPVAAPLAPEPVSTPPPPPAAAAADINNNVPAPAPPAPAPVTPAPEPEKPKDSSGRETKTAVEPSDSTQDDKLDKQIPSPAQLVQSPTADVLTARSPAPSEVPPPSATTAAASDDQKPSDDVKTAKIINENSLKEKSEGESTTSGQSPAPPTPEAGALPAIVPSAGGSEREKATSNDNEGNTGSSRSAPPGPVDPAALGIGADGKKKKKSKKDKSKGKKKPKKDGKSGGTEDDKKKKKKSRKSKDKKKKSKKNSGGGEKGPEEKKSEEDGAPPPPAPGI